MVNEMGMSAGGRSIKHKTRHQEMENVLCLPMPGPQQKKDINLTPQFIAGGL